MKETQAPTQARLNPFAFPSETNVRFTLLVVAALMLAFFLGMNETMGIGLVKIADTPATVNTGDLDSIQQGQAEWSEAFTKTLEMAVVPGGLMICMLILATIIYRGHPGRIRRKKSLQLITRSDDVQFVDAVQDLARSNGISPAPIIEMSGGTRSVDGQAFGLRKHYSLRLGRGMRLLLFQSPDTFRAILLHELAHIANADIGRTYFAEAIWMAFVILAVIPTLAYIAFNFAQGLSQSLTDGLTRDEWMNILAVKLPTFLLLLFQVGGTLIVVAAIRASLLRAREVYADWRAASWGAATSLVDILRGNASAKDKTARRGFWWRLHPTPQERLDALQKPDGLFRVTSELPFFVGVLLCYVLKGATFLGLTSAIILVAGAGAGTMMLFQSLQESPFWPLFLIGALAVPAILVMAFALCLAAVYLVVGSLGLEMEREAVADMVAGRQGWIPYLKLWKPAALAAIGFQVGSLLTPYGLLPLLPGLINFQGLIVIFMTLFFTVSVACLTWLWLIYARFFARRILGSHVGRASPQHSRRLLTLALSGLLLALYLPAVIGPWTILMVATNNTTMLIPLSSAFLIAVIIALCLFLVIFGVTWLFVQAYRFIRRPHCPTCGQATRQRYAVGQACESCGQNLAPWLFMTRNF
jgi:Zn-dependent protease with chaperone function